MTPGSPRAVYVGWQGRGNAGDDAMFSAIAPSLAPVDVLSLPVYATELAAALAGGRLAGVRGAPVLLGGGTLVGRSVWRRTLTRKAFVVAGRADRFTIGTGVEDPSFQGRHSFSDGGAELGRWAPLLGTFRRVAVRGPRSRDLLASVGVDARVVGDPALLLTAPEDGAARHRSTEPAVAVTLGFGDDLWGHDQAAVTAAVAGALAHLVDGGWRVRLVPLNGEDVPEHARLARALGHDRVDLVPAAGAETYLRTVAGCDVVLAQRLHAMVLSAAAGTPFVALDYQPKCADFLASIGWEPWSVRTDAVSAGGLAGLVDGLHGQRDGESGRLRSSVERLRASLRAELEAVRTAVTAGREAA